MTGERHCAECGNPVDPTSRYVWRRVVGWARRGKAGGSDVALREHRDEYLCEGCMVLLKGKLNTGQGSLL